MVFGGFSIINPPPTGNIKTNKNMENVQTKLVKFYNWTNEDFTGMWNKKPEYFKAGESKFMEAWRADHYATGLTNRELLRHGFEHDTSPKNPEQNMKFMEYYNKAYLKVDDAFRSDDEVRNEALNLNIQNEIVETKPKPKTKPKAKKVEEKFEGLETQV